MRSQPQSRAPPLSPPKSRARSLAVLSSERPTHSEALIPLRLPRIDPLGRPPPWGGLRHRRWTCHRAPKPDQRQIRFVDCHANPETRTMMLG